MALQNLPVAFCLDRAGLTGPDGPTHHGVFDTVYLRAFPNFVVMARASLEDFEIGPEDAMLSFLPFSHVFERQSGVVVAISSGCEIWLSHGIPRLAEDIAAANPSVMLGVPRMFEKIVDRIRDEVRKQPGWKRFLVYALAQSES